MAKCLMIRTLFGLMLNPNDARSRDALKGLALGASVQVDVVRPRNVKRHNLYWALVTNISDAIPGNLTAENISDLLKLETGHCTIIRTSRETYKVPKSISFSKMDDAEFCAFLDRCCQFICTTWLAHIKPSNLRTEIEQMVGMGAIAHAEAPESERLNA